MRGSAAPAPYDGLGVIVGPGGVHASDLDVMYYPVYGMRRIGAVREGSDLVLRAHIKHTPSISSPQNTVNQDGEDIQIRIKGRHDPVIVPRAVVVVESMTALTLVDALLTGMGARMENLKKVWK